MPQIRCLIELFLEYLLIILPPYVAYHVLWLFDVAKGGEKRDDLEA